MLEKFDEIILKCEDFGDWFESHQGWLILLLVAGAVLSSVVAYNIFCR